MALPSAYLGVSTLMQGEVHYKIIKQSCSYGVGSLDAFGEDTRMNLITGKCFCLAVVKSITKLAI